MDDFIESSPSVSFESEVIQERLENIGDLELLLLGNDPMPKVYEDRMGIIKRRDAGLTPAQINSLLAYEGRPGI